MGRVGVRVWECRAAKKGGWSSYELCSFMTYDD